MLKKINAGVAMAVGCAAARTRGNQLLCSCGFGVQQQLGSTGSGGFARCQGPATAHVGPWARRAGPQSEGGIERSGRGNSADETQAKSKENVASLRLTGDSQVCSTNSDKNGWADAVQASHIGGEKAQNRRFQAWVVRHAFCHVYSDH